METPDVVEMDGTSKELQQDINVYPSIEIPKVEKEGIVIFEHSFAVALPKISQFIGDFNYTLRVPSPHTIITQSLLTYSANTASYRAFRYIALLSLNLADEALNLSPLIRFSCLRVDKGNGQYFNDCRLTLISSPDSLSLTEKDPLDDSEWTVVPRSVCV